MGKSGSQDLLSKSLIQISVDEPSFVPCLLFGLRPNYRWDSSVKSCLTLCEPKTTACQASLSITNTQSLLNLMSIELVMQSNHLIFSHPHLLPPSIFPRIRVFSNESALHIRWLKYRSFSFIIRPSNEYSGLISFSIDWLDLAVQGTLKSLLQHFSNTTVQKHQFFSIQLSL